MDQIVDGEARERLTEQVREAAARLRETGEEEEVLDTSDDSVRSPVNVENDVPEPPYWGVQEITADLDDVYPYLDRHVLFKLHWGGRGKKGEEWRQIVEGHDGEEGFAPKLKRMWAEQDYLEPRARIGYFPANSEGNDVVVFDPQDHDKEITRLTFPRQPGHDRICLADFYKPIDSGERDVVVIQGVTMGPKSTERMAELEQAGEFAEQLFTHGLAVQSAEGLAEWLHAQARKELGIELDEGRRYSWGYPACPDQSEHEKVWQLLDLEQIGMHLSDGFAVMPEQSTVAIIAHHAQAVYFGMKSGFVPKGKRPDELIAGTDSGGELPPDEDPDTGDPGGAESDDDGEMRDAA
ncbi:MAG: vitamin B12 dependent-methionine synthase activation domain-containing protein, partial [Acidimicrobiales bacterium]